MGQLWGNSSLGGGGKVGAKSCAFGADGSARVSSDGSTLCWQCQQELGPFFVPRAGCSLGWCQGDAGTAGSTEP